MVKTQVETITQPLSSLLVDVILTGMNKVLTGDIVPLRNVLLHDVFYGYFAEEGYAKRFSILYTL